MKNYTMINITLLSIQELTFKPLRIYSLFKKYSDMLNMKALVGIRIILMGKEFE